MGDHKNTAETCWQPATNKTPWGGGLQVASVARSGRERQAGRQPRAKEAHVASQALKQHKRKIHANKSHVTSKASR